MNKTINQLTNLAEISSSDELPIWDSSASDTKKVSVENLGKEIIKEFNTYSTTEYFTGKYWIDGKPIYRTVFTGLNFGGSTSGWNNTGATKPTGADKFISGYAIRSSDSAVIHPFSYRFNNSNIQYTTPTAIGSTDILIIEYTKASA